MKHYPIKDHAPSLLPDGKTWKLVWSDEFDGDTLDMTKWSYRYHIMGLRHETFTDEGAALDGKGNLVLSRIEKEGQFYSTQLQTGENYMDRPGTRFGNNRFTWPIAKISTPKFMHKFGYYECRCRLQQKEGWWSAFWLQSPLQGSTLNPAVSGVEIDIMESFAPNVVEHNLHWDGCGEDWKTAGKPRYEIPETADGYHIFGLLWNRDGYKFYVDGEMTWSADGPVSETEQFLLISTECKGYRAMEPQPDPALFTTGDDEFLVDYIRVYDEIEE